MNHSIESPVGFCVISATNAKDDGYTSVHKALVS